MTELELRKMASAVQDQFKDPDRTDEQILSYIKETPELINAVHPSGANLFLTAVSRGRFSIALALADMGADVHWRCEASLIHGNALNVARSPEQAEQLLGLGIEIEKSLSLGRGPYRNPAVMAAFHNDTTMLPYWLDKQKELFADDAQYIEELVYATIRAVSMMNQYNMLSCVIKDDELYGVLKKVYAEHENPKSIKLILSALRYIEDEALEGRKKELRKILNARKKELAAKA